MSHAQWGACDRLAPARHCRAVDSAGLVVRAARVGAQRAAQAAKLRWRLVRRGRGHHRTHPSAPTSRPVSAPSLAQPVCTSADHIRCASHTLCSPPRATPRAPLVRSSARYGNRCASDYASELLGEPGAVEVQVARKHAEDSLDHDPDSVRPRALLPAVGSMAANEVVSKRVYLCLLYTSPSPRDRQKSRMPSSA